MGTINCNWKVFLDAFQEIYHLNYLHRQTLTDTFSWVENPLGEPAYFRTFGPHRALSMGYNPKQRGAPMASIAQRHASDITSTGGSAMANARSSMESLGAGINPGGLAHWAIDVTTIFPNIVWLVGANSSIFQKVWPIDKEHIRDENYAFFRKPQKANERFAREYSFGLFFDTIVEDILNTEFSRQALQSGAKKHFHLQTTEFSVRHHHHHHYIARHVRGEAAHG